MRKKIYQLSTEVDKKNKKVFKIARKDEAVDFLQSFITKYTTLSKDKIFTSDKIILLPVKKTDTIKKIEFPYIEGYTFEKKLSHKNNSINGLILQYEQLIESFDTEKITKKQAKDFEEIFGKNAKGTIGISSGILDILFSNLIEESATKNVYLIDYEWVFDFPIPKKYLIRRALKKCNIMHKKNILIYNTISLKEEIKFILREHGFQKYVNRNTLLLSSRALDYFGRKIFFGIRNI